MTAGLAFRDQGSLFVSAFRLARLIEIKKPSLSLCFPDDLSRRSDRIFCRSGLCCEELKMATHLRIVLLAAATAAGTLFGAQSAQAATAAARPVPSAARS